MSDIQPFPMTIQHVCPSCGNTKPDAFDRVTGKYMCLNRGGHGPTGLVDQMVPADPPPVTLEDVAAYFAIGDDPEDWAGQIRAIEAATAAEIERLTLELATGTAANRDQTTTVHVGTIRLWAEDVLRFKAERDQARAEAVAERTARRMETTGRSETNFAADHPFTWETS